MLGNDDSDEDFDFDLDEVVRIATQQNVKEVEVVANHKSKEIHQTLKPKESVVEDWGNDVIFEENPDLLNKVVPEVDLHLKTSSLLISQQEHLSVFKEKTVCQLRNKDLMNNSHGSLSSNLKSQQTTQGLRLQNKPIIQKGPAKFPGPAGLFNLAPAEKKSREKRRKTNHGKLTNRDGLYCWDNALNLLSVKNPWENNKMNLEMINNTIAPDVVYLTAPLLVVGISKIEFTPQHDVSCVLQDPSGEVRGRILKDVFTDNGKLIQVGSILVLRRPSVLQMNPNCFVTITKKCLIGIFSSESNEIIRLRKFAKEDLITWLSEPVIYGDPVNEETSEGEPIEPLVTLFTSAGSALAATSMARFGTPSSGHRSNEPFITPSNYNRPRPTMNVTPTNTTPLPHHRLSVMPPPNPIGQPTRSPINNGNQFSYKSPSAIVSTSRPAPYRQPNRLSPVLPSISTAGNKPEKADENFLSQFLQGVDTDALFEDF